jgi:acetolactate synthase-1/2/3 large subunit
MSALGRNTLCSDALVDILKYLEVEIIFSITGAGNLAILDALTRDASIKIVYSHHEQAAVMEAQGYSRVTGKIGVALVTTGGGTSNTLTGLLSAYLDSIPILLISGNESSYHCQNENHLRAYGVQGFDSNKVFESVTKKSVRLDYPENIKVLIKSLVFISYSRI